MNIQIICAYCSKVIGNDGYKTDGHHFFHAGCQPINRRYLSETKPIGSDFTADAINRTNPIGIEMSISSTPSCISGLNLMSKKDPFCWADLQ